MNQNEGYICYVDVGRTTAFATKRMLTKNGFTVDHFEETEHAVVAHFEKNYDLLITDLKVPFSGKGGDELVRFIRKSSFSKKHHIPIIVIAGSHDGDVFKRIYNAGANSIITKPISEENLVQQIQKLMPNSKPVTKKSVTPQNNKDIKPKKTPVLQNQKNNNSSVAGNVKPVNLSVNNNFSDKETRLNIPGNIAAALKPAVSLEKNNHESQHNVKPTNNKPRFRPIIPPKINSPPAQESIEISWGQEANDPPVADSSTQLQTVDPSLREDDNSIPTLHDELSKQELMSLPQLTPIGTNHLGSTNSSRSLQLVEDFDNFVENEYEDDMLLDTPRWQIVLDNAIEKLKKEKKRVGIGLSAFVLLVLLGFFILPGEEYPVQTVMPELGSLNRTISVPGKVMSKNKVDISPFVQGQIVAVMVKDGDKVQKGQLLAEIRNENTISKVKRAESRFISAKERGALAKTTYERMQKAYDLGAISRQDVEEQKAYYSSSKAQETVAKEEFRTAFFEFKKLKITAPFSGTLINHSAQVGQTVTVNDILFTIADLSQREIRVRVDTADSSSIRVGHSVKMTSDAYPNWVWQEKVKRVAPTTDNKNRTNTVAVFISLGSHAPELRFGEQVDAQITTFASDEKLKLPLSALVKRDGQSTVMILNDGRVEFSPIETGIEDMTHMEIVKGVELGQEVIIPSNKKLQQGDRVRVVNSLLQK